MRGRQLRQGKMEPQQRCSADLACGVGYSGPRATPTITDKYVYEIGTFGDAFCFDRKTGAIVWKQDFGRVSLP